MDISQIEAIARRVPILSDADALTISPLAGGHTNENFRIDAAGRSYVLRVAGEGSALLGIDRPREAYNQRAAAAAGVSPDVVGFIEPEGYLVSRFVNGQKISPEQMRTPEKIRAVARALHQIHDGTAFAGTFSPFRTFDEYTSLAREKGALLPKNFAFVEKFKRDCERALYYDSPLVPRPIHADLLNENFLEDEGRVWILDWEYSGMGDIFFDLANFADHHQFEDNQEGILLEEYFGQVRGRDLARLKLMRIMSDAREGMWGVVQSAASQLDVDFASYAHQFFERMLQHATDPRYPQWLKSAAGIE
jgi:thiamine kinase-like enzyme